MPANLPRVLAGPIVRRVEATGCSFWVALSEAATVTVSLWTNTRMAGAAGAPVATSPATALTKFGENLFAGVITVPMGNAGGAPLIPGSLYSYDLSFSGTFGASDLQQEGLLRDETAGSRLAGVDAAAPLHLALGYLENRLPSFVAPPPTVEQLRLAHGSCRKPHGPKDDALAWLDDEIEENFSDTTQRVQQLFLTGDQIYADEVPACLLPMLNALGRDVVGSTREEKVPVTGGEFDGTIANFPALRRTKLIRETAGMSSAACSSHLVTFPEFAATYLAVWSPRVWRALATNDQLFIAAPANATLKDNLTDFEACFKDAPDPRAKWRSEREQGVDDERTQTEGFRDVVGKVARVLANTATYMIFDDHEVTDDWNLNKRWRNRVYSRPLGKAIVRNALMAYAIFQAWGNDPAEFAKADSKNKAFMTEMQKVLGVNPAVAGSLPVGSTDQLDELAGSTEAGNDKRAKWNFSVPGPRHLVIALDSRTRRKYTGEGIAPPNLLGDTLDKQVPQGPLTDGRELLFVLSPAPVFGPDIIDRIGTPIFEIVADFTYGIKKIKQRGDDPCDPGGPDIGVEAADAESWAVNEEARENLFKRLATYSSVIILSGDVHYGVSMRLDYWKGAAANSVPIVQLTSSPTHNTFKSIVEAITRQNALLQRYEEGLPPELLAWEVKNPLSLPDGKAISPGRRARMRRTPVLLPSRGWPTGTTIPADKQPAWRWRIELLTDQRPDSELPANAARLPALGATDLVTDNPATHIPTYRAVAARHQVAALTDNFVNLRRIVFVPNLGLVDIERDGGALKVRHTLLSRSASAPFTGVANTVHETTLAPSAQPAPTLQTEE